MHLQGCQLLLNAEEEAVSGIVVVSKFRDHIPLRPLVGLRGMLRRYGDATKFEDSSKCVLLFPRFEGWDGCILRGPTYPRIHTMAQQIPVSNIGGSY